MDSIQLSTLAALAGKWQTEADCGAGSADRRAALRECADTVRMLCEVRFEDCPHAAPHRYCAECPVSPCPIALGEHAVAKRGAVPEGYDIAPTFRGYAKLGSGRYVLHNCPRTDEDHPSLVIAIATEEEKADRQVGELRHVTPGLMIQPDRIAVRLDFENAAALDALEQQLRFLREDSFPDSLAAPAPAPAKVSMPERLADAIVREVAELPDRDSPADWPAAMLVTSDELRGIVLAHIQRGAVPEGDDGKRVLREVFALCEDTETKCSDETGDFARGRRFEAKGIARAIGAWYQEEFCGRAHMGEPAAPAPDQFRDAAKMMATPAEVPMPEPDMSVWDTEEVRTYSDECIQQYGAACRAAGEAAGYARGLAEAGRDAERMKPLILEIEELRLYARALCKAVDAATDFIGTVAGGASWWDDVWADHAAALDRARERISQAALRGEVK